MISKLLEAYKQSKEKAYQEDLECREKKAESKRKAARKIDSLVEDMISKPCVLRDHEMLCFTGCVHFDAGKLSVWEGKWMVAKDPRCKLWT